jgi:hypothetical protein
MNNNHGVIRDERGQDEPSDKDRAQQTSSRKERGQADPPLQSDDVTIGEEAQKRRGKIQKQEKAEGNR